MYASVRIRKIRGVPRGRVGKAHNGRDVPGRSSCLYKGQRGHSSTVFVSLEAHGVPRKPITAEEFFMITDKPDIFDRIMSLKILKWANPFYTKYKEVLMYLLFGGLTTLVSVGVFALFESHFGLNEHISNIISWLTAVLFAFVTNRIWVFRQRLKVLRLLFFRWQSFTAVGCLPWALRSLCSLYL